MRKSTQGIYPRLRAKVKRHTSSSSIRGGLPSGRKFPGKKNQLTGECQQAKSWSASFRIRIQKTGKNNKAAQPRSFLPCVCPVLGPGQGQIQGQRYRGLILHARTFWDALPIKIPQLRTARPHREDASGHVVNTRSPPQFLSSQFLNPFFGRNVMHVCTLI